MNSLSKKEIDPEIYSSEEISPGQWWWVQDETDEDRWLGCILRLGSNYVEIAAASNSKFHIRVHLDQAPDILKERVCDAEKVIEERIAEGQNKVRLLLKEAQQITSSAVGPEENNSEQALTAVNSDINLNDFKQSLIQIKNDSLPSIFENVKKEMDSLSNWMTASLIPQRNLLEKERKKKHSKN